MYKKVSMSSIKLTRLYQLMISAMKKRKQYDKGREGRTDQGLGL